MKASFSYFYLALILLVSTQIEAQVNPLSKPGSQVFQQADAGKRGANTIRVMFYNAENLFDPKDDSITSDEEYQPTGMRGWTYTRLKQKQLNIAKVVLAVGGWEPPDLIGLCEVENSRVLFGLTKDTPLKNFGYRFIHYDSPDPRGIDVALLYRPGKFKVIQSIPIPVHFPSDATSHTRDILYVKGIVNKRDTIHVFVNHWPSKFGGALATVPKRKFVASMVRNLSDSLLAVNPNANILIMGDLNDSPYEESVSKVLRAKMDSVNLAPDDLYDMLAGAGISWKKGTIKFREEWETIDHMIISRPLLKYTHPNGLHIFDAPFLLQDDEAWYGKKPFRTYYGAKYIGGYSDHLPVYADFSF
jgi:endonuclease/exonuclease/phosphatase family metal-dependent hydrolase